MENKFILDIIKNNPSIIDELGERLWVKIKEVVIPEWMESFNALTKQDCIDYIYNLTINRTYDGYLREKSVVNDSLVKIFPQIRFEESPPEMDHSGDIDYLGFVSEKIAFGIQIKPITAMSNFGNYNISDRMKASFDAFKDEFSGKVFMVFSLDGEIANNKIIDEIRMEIDRLNNISTHSK